MNFPMSKLLEVNMLIIVERCRWDFVIFRQLYQYITRPSGVAMRQKTPEMNVSRAVDNQNVQIF